MRGFERGFATQTYPVTAQPRRINKKQCSYNWQITDYLCKLINKIVIYRLLNENGII